MNNPSWASILLIPYSRCATSMSSTVGLEPLSVHCRCSDSARMRAGDKNRSATTASFAAAAGTQSAELTRFPARFISPFKD